MRFIQDLGGFLVGRPGLARLAQGNRPPVAFDDTWQVDVDSPATRIPVLANDIDPDGDALTLVSAYAALGTAVAEADGTVSYTPPPGVSGSDTVVYEIADGQGRTDSGQVNVVIETAPVAVEEMPDGQLRVTAGEGDVDLAVSGTTRFNGTHGFDTALLNGGPVNLVPPLVEDAPVAGATLNAIAGLWAHDAADTPVRQWQWERGGAAIAGATGPAHTVTGDDVAAGLGVTETLSDALGQRLVRLVLAGPAAFTPDADAQLVAWHDADDAATITAAGGSVSAWADKAGGAALIQTSGPDQPLTGLRQLGGRNVLDFDGQHLERGLTLPASGDVAVHVALALDGTASAFAAALSMDAVNDFQFDAAAAGQFDGRLNAAGIGPGVALTGGPFAGGLIVSLVFDRTSTGTAEVFVAGSSRASMVYDTALDTAQTFRVMTNRSSNAWIDGAVGEVIVTGNVSNRADHHTYLATKWGLS